MKLNKSNQPITTLKSGSQQPTGSLHFRQLSQSAAAGNPGTNQNARNRPIASRHCGSSKRATQEESLQPTSSQSSGTEPANKRSPNSPPAGGRELRVRNQDRPLSQSGSASAAVSDPSSQSDPGSDTCEPISGSAGLADRAIGQRPAADNPHRGHHGSSGKSPSTSEDPDPVAGATGDEQVTAAGTPDSPGSAPAFDSGEPPTSTSGESPDPGGFTSGGFPIFERFN